MTLGREWNERINRAFRDYYEPAVREDMARRAELLARMPGPKLRRRRWTFTVPWWPYFARDEWGYVTVTIRPYNVKFGPWEDAAPPLRQSFGTIRISGRSEHQPGERGERQPGRDADEHTS